MFIHGSIYNKLYICKKGEQEIIKNKIVMMRENLINKTIKTLSKLPNDKIREVSDFTEYILKKYEEETLQKGIEKLVSVCYSQLFGQY